MDVLCSDNTGTLTDGTVKIQATIDVKDYVKLDEHPYDFIRKRLSIMLSELVKNSGDNQKHIMITKGALTNVLEICTKAEIEDGKVVDIEEVS